MDSASPGDRRGAACVQLPRTNQIFGPRPGGEKKGHRNGAVPGLFH